MAFDAIHLIYAALHVSSTQVGACAILVAHSDHFSAGQHV